MTRPPDERPVRRMQPAPPPSGALWGPQAAPGARPAAGGQQPAPSRPAPGPRDHQAPHRPATAQPPNVLGLVIVATAALVATIVTFGVFLPALSTLGSAGASGGQDAAVQALPAQISVCGTDWDRGDRVLSEAEVFARDERDPITVSTGPLPACPDAVVASSTSPEGPVTTVYVAVAEDGFVPYTRDVTP